MHQLALLALAPVLYAQGKYARRKTQQLAEPAGARQGHSGQGRPLRLLIAGDSAAAGVGVEQQESALSGVVVAQLSQHFHLQWKLNAQSGDASAQLLEKLKAAPAEPFETVLISIGVNDVTGLTRSRVWMQNLQTIIDLLQDKFSAQQIFWSSIPPMGLFPALPNPLRWCLGLRARHFNRLLQQAAEQHPNCRFLQIPYPEDLRFIASDGFHPGAQAYDLWGQQAAQLIHDSLLAQTT